MSLYVFPAVEYFPDLCETSLKRIEKAKRKRKQKITKIKMKKYG